MRLEVSFHELTCQGRGFADRSRAGIQTIPFVTKLLSHLRTLDTPTVIFTISPSWIARAGTVALGMSGNASPERKARIVNRVDGKEGSWRPGSIFGGLWTSAPIEEAKSESEREDEEEDEDEGERTIKGRSSMDSFDGGGIKRIPCASTQPSTKARLSSLFTDWIAPEVSTSVSRVVPPAAVEGGTRTRLVSEPVAIEANDVSRRFSSWSPGNRASMIEVGISEEETADEDDLEASLESLMVRFAACLRFAS
jgi:hypothetical protein